MTAAGLVVGTFLADRIGAAWDLRQEEILNAVVVVAIAGVLGARLFYLLGESPDSGFGTSMPWRSGSRPGWLSAESGT
jgi:prolipoprotein diacylglyceryltransferase